MKGITNYQLEVLKHLQEIEAGTGRRGDFDQVLGKLSWAPSKESAQFVVRALITKGFISKVGLESRRGRNRVCFAFTEKGKLVLDPRGAYVPEKEVEISVPELPELLED